MEEPRPRAHRQRQRIEQGLAKVEPSRSETKGSSENRTIEDRFKVPLRPVESRTRDRRPQKVQKQIDQNKNAPRRDLLEKQTTKHVNARLPSTTTSASGTLGGKSYGRPGQSTKPLRDQAESARSSSTDSDNAQGQNVAAAPAESHALLAQKTQQVKEQLDGAKKSATTSQPVDDKYAAPPPATITDPSGCSYEVGEKLGRGGFAICYEANTAGGQGRSAKVALKIVKTKMPSKVEEKFRTELQIHSKMHHAHIVDFHRAFTLGESTFIVLGLCSNGSLKDMCAARRHLSPPEVRRLAIQICGALHYMHTRLVIHRDLKMGNIFMDKNMMPKIGDFGLASLLLRDEHQAIIRRVTFCGTPNYIAPEVLDKGKGHDQSVDMWALGVLLYTIMVGTTPFSKVGDKDHKPVFERVRNCQWAWPDHSYKSVPKEGRDLVEQLLVEDDSKRPSAEDVVHHPFFSMQGGIPVGLESEAMRKPPAWLDNRTMPREMKAGSEKTAPEELIKASGFTSGSRLPMFHQLLDEEAAGRGPTVPLKTVYEMPRTAESKQSPPGGGIAMKALVSKKVRMPRPTVYMLDAKESTVVEEQPPDLEGLLTRIKSALRGESASASSYPACPQPLVTRFANYADQGGIGYVLATGVTGCLISKSRPVKSGVLTNALQRDGARSGGAWPGQMCRLQPHRARTDVYLYERDATGALRRLAQPFAAFADSWTTTSSVDSSANASSSTTNDSTPPDPATAAANERAKAKLHLFSNHKKLANALLAQRPGPPQLRTRDPVTAFVSRYQRCGNVTVWAWSDGALQFDFPDHTKLRLATEGRDAAFHHPPFASLVDEELPAALDVLPQQPLRVQPRRPGKVGTAPKQEPEPSRPTALPTVPPQPKAPPAVDAVASGTDVLEVPLAAMLRPDASAATAEVAQCFRLRSKAKFVYQLVDCWRRHGRAGRVGGERLFWSEGEARTGASGDGADGEARKEMSWVTVEL